MYVPAGRKVTLRADFVEVTLSDRVSRSVSRREVVMQSEFTLFSHVKDVRRTRSVASQPINWIGQSPGALKVLGVRAILQI